MLFQAAHYNPMAGYLGQAATLKHPMTRFFWPAFTRMCAACCGCQLVNPPASQKAPLSPLPLLPVPFERICMDLIGPLEWSARGIALHVFLAVRLIYLFVCPKNI